jgi:apolipoprotein N-acyltransferase
MKITNFLSRYSSIFLFILGVIAVFGFAPFYAFPAVFFSLAGLILYWLHAKNIKTAALQGFIFALGFFGVGIYWIFISLHTFGGMPALMAAFATFCLCAFMASFTALVGALAFLFKKNPIAHLMAIAIFWALADWTRSWIFTGFPWLTMGYSQVPFGPFAGFLPVVGVYGVSLITVLFAGLIASLFMQKFSLLTRRNFIVVLTILWVSGIALKQVEWTKPIGKAFSVALVQGNIAQETKWSPEYAERTIDIYLTALKKSHAELTILPETALPILSHQLDHKLVENIAKHAKMHLGNTIIGIVEYNPKSQAYFNSALSFGSDPTQHYQKSHLVPFGEFIPLKTLFGWIYRDLLNMPLSDLSRGEKFQTPMQLAAQKVAVNICYEDVFGEEIIRQLPEATILANISNDAWYGKSYAADQHLQFSQARALETGRMVLRATNTGATAIINPRGKLLAHAPHDEETILTGQAQGYQGTTPYVRFGNWPFIIFAFIVIALLWLRKNK